MPNILVDFHHTSLYSSLQMLFDRRLGFYMYRPIGLEWYTEGFWHIWPHIDTANQYLSTDQAFTPSDGTPPLNKYYQYDGWGRLPEGVYEIQNNEYPDMQHMACTLEFFKSLEFDYLVASIPAHIEPFRELIRRYQPKAKLIYQVGNNWNFDVPGLNVLASTLPRPVPEGSNVVFYHQEFDVSLFRGELANINRLGHARVTSFTNVLQGESLARFLELERLLPNVEFLSYGGQCRDGCVTGSENIGKAFQDTTLVFHHKPGGDGYGHVLHNAFAAGRPVITAKHHYRGQLGSLLLDGVCIDMDHATPIQLAQRIDQLLHNPEALQQASLRAHATFDRYVDFDAEEQDIRRWLERAI